MLTVLEIIKKTTEFLAGKGIESPRLNAEQLIGHALGLGRMQLYLQFERPLAEKDLEQIRPLVRRRGQHEPLQYILGETEFFGLRLKVDRRALIPRPETEQLVEHALAAREAPPPTVLDLGTGTGAIALAIAQTCPQAEVTAVDASDGALALARENAAALNLTERVAFVKSDWFAALPQDARFDLIVANPPYLSAEETAATAPEVRGFEPASALTADENGLSALRHILGAAPRFMAPDAVCVMETGIHQHAALREIAAAAGFASFESRADLTGRDRFVIVRRTATKKP